MEPFLYHQEGEMTAQDTGTKTTEATTTDKEAETGTYTLEEALCCLRGVVDPKQQATILQELARSGGKQRMNTRFRVHP